MIQDLQWGGPGLDVSLIATMFETIPAFRCLKVEVAPAGPKYSAVLEATGGKLHVSGGWASEQMIEALDRGVDVFFSTAMTRFYRRILAGIFIDPLNDPVRDYSGFAFSLSSRQ